MSLAGHLEFRAARRFDQKRPRRNQRGQFGVTELFQQAEDDSVDQLLPDVLPRLEVPADARGIDAFVERRRIKGQHAALAPAKDADPGISSSGVFLQPVDQGQDLLQLVTDDVPPQFESWTIKVPAAGQLGLRFAA